MSVEEYTRPEGVLGGPCLHCGMTQPEHVGLTCEQAKAKRDYNVDAFMQSIRKTKGQPDTIKDCLQTMICSAEVYTDAEGTVLAYKIKTGALHKLIGLLGLWVPQNLPAAPSVAMTDHDDLIARRKVEYVARRLCADHNGKWEPGRCLLCEIESLQAECDALVNGDEYQAMQRTLAEVNSRCESLQEELAAQTRYSIRLQRMIESLKSDAPVPYPELHHHKMIVTARAELAEARAEIARLTPPRGCHDVERFYRDDPEEQP